MAQACVAQNRNDDCNDNPTYVSRVPKTASRESLRAPWASNPWRRNRVGKRRLAVPRRNPTEIGEVSGVFIQQRLTNGTDRAYAFGTVRRKRCATVWAFRFRQFRFPTTFRIRVSAFRSLALVACHENLTRHPCANCGLIPISNKPNLRQLVTARQNLN